jgi:DHA2 family multidrug resistance protein
MLAGMAATLRQAGVSASDATAQAYARIGMMLQQQATTLAYIDVISVMALVVLCLVPLVLLMRKGKPGDSASQSLH